MGGSELHGVGGLPFLGFDLSSQNGISGAPSLRLRSGQALAFVCEGGNRTAHTIDCEGPLSDMHCRSRPLLRKERGILCPRGVTRDQTQRLAHPPNFMTFWNTTPKTSSDSSDSSNSPAST